MMNIFTSSRAPTKSNSLRITHSTAQNNVYRIPIANSKPLTLNKNLDPLRDGAAIRPIDRFNAKLNPVFDKNKTYLKKKNTQEDLSIEKELEDIEEHDGNKENYSINRIPVSPIAFKQMPSSLTRQSTSVDRRYDSCHLSTEPSIGSTSIHTTPNQDPKRMSYFGDHLDVITNELKAPSMISESYKQRLSINSLNEFDGKETPRRSHNIFGSGSKFATQMSLPNNHHEGQSNSNFHGPIRPTALSGVKIENKNVSQSTEFSHLIKHTPPKRNIMVSTEKSHGTPIATTIGSATKNKSFTEPNMTDSISSTSNRFRQSYHKQSRSSYTSEGFKKCMTSLNRLDDKLEKFDAKNWIKQVLKTNPRKKLRCSCDANLSATDESCSRALGWLYKRYKPEEFGYLKTTYEKIVAEQNILESEHVKQIQKDIYRTYPSCKLFEPESEGAMTLERLLNAFAKYDPVVGYVQGMNFIAGSLLYHTEEYLAFWLLVMIFETLEMRDIYLPRLPGLSKHCQIIDMLIFNKLPDVYPKLCEFSIKPEMFCSEWILTLFGSVVPIEQMGIIYDNLLDDGWPFFYKLILAFLTHFSKEILHQTDVIEVLTILKSQNHIPQDTKKSKKSPYYIDWKVLCQKAQEFTIDSDFIYEMHMKFDSDNLWFKTTS